jgi:penicillin V acylase-like amidase (Ntn superfamily)
MKCFLTVRRGFWVGLLVSFSIAGDSFSCTTFCLLGQNHMAIGKSYDWSKEQGMLVINKRDVKKSALQLAKQDIPLKWKSIYGSVTFNQYGRELPNAGMNEKGLVVEVMQLDKSTSTAGSDRAVNESQFVQYLLDSADSVDQAVRLAKQVNWHKILVPLHYMICDRNGSCSVLEFMNGGLVVSQQGGRAPKVLTNHPYDVSVQHLSKFVGFGGDTPIPSGSGSLDRFVRASDLVRRNQGIDGVHDLANAARTILTSVNNQLTKWQIVYQPSSMTIDFRTVTFSNWKSFSMEYLDFDCQTDVKVWSLLNNSVQQDGTNWKSYTADENEKLVRSSLGTTLPSVVVQMAISLPETTTCVP